MSNLKSSTVGRRVAGFASIGLALIAITPASMFATPIPLGGGGVVNLSDNGTLLGVTSVPPCIAFSGNTATCNSTTAIQVTSGDPLFSTTGTIKDFSSTPVVGFKTVNL